MKHRVLILLKAGVSVGIIIWLTQKLDWSELGVVFSRVSWGYVLIGAGLSILGQTITALRWLLLARDLSLPVPFIRAWRHLFVALFFAIFLPGAVGGDALRAWLLGKELGPGTMIRSGYSVATERINGIFGMILMATVIGWFFRGNLPSAWLWGLTILCLTLYVFFPLVPILLRWLVSHHRAWVRKLFPEEILVYWQPHGHWWIALGVSMLYQCIQGGMGLLAGVSLGVDVPVAYYFFLVPTVALISALPISIGGHGVREGLFVLLLGWVGLDTEPALALGLLFMVSALASSLLGGIVFLLTRNRHDDILPHTEAAEIPVASTPSRESP